MTTPSPRYPRRVSDRNLHNTSSADAKATTPDIQVHGNPDAWECICKASSQSQGWMKSTKRMRVEGGYIYQSTTEHRSGGLVTACSDSMVFVPDFSQLCHLSELPEVE